MIFEPSFLATILPRGLGLQQKLTWPGWKLQFKRVQHVAVQQSDAITHLSTKAEIPPWSWVVDLNVPFAAPNSVWNAVPMTETSDPHTTECLVWIESSNGSKRKKKNEN